MDTEISHFRNFIFPKKTYTLLLVLFIMLTSIGYSAMNVNLNISGEVVFVPENNGENIYGCSNSTETLVIQESGRYLIETWGAEGGAAISNAIILKGAEGGYSKGEVYLVAGTTLYINVGCKGKDGYPGATTGLDGGFNGGGSVPGGALSAINPGSGGGATDVRINSNSSYARLIVAGGGGGAGTSAVATGSFNMGGQGGGTNGSNGSYYPSVDSNTLLSTIDGRGGTQTIGGEAGTDQNQIISATAGSFGQGGASGLSTNVGGGAGGGGWYGGGGAAINGWGGGGSGWIYTEETFNYWKSTVNQDNTNKWTLSDDYYLHNAETIDGRTKGNVGNGKVSITFLEKENSNYIEVTITKNSFFIGENINIKDFLTVNIFIGETIRQLDSSEYIVSNFDTSAITDTGIMRITYGDLTVNKEYFIIPYPDVFIFTKEYLEGGHLYLDNGATINITTDNLNGTAGLSITGRPSTGWDIMLRVNMIRWYIDIDLTSYNELSFYARLGAMHGSMGVFIDDIRALYYSYYDYGWYNHFDWTYYTLDVSQYTGIHTLSLMGGYADWSGNVASNTQYCDIRLKK